jgi:hypothetical protein
VPVQIQTDRLEFILRLGAHLLQTKRRHLRCEHQLLDDLVGTTRRQALKPAGRNQCKEREYCEFFDMTHLRSEMSMAAPCAIGAH